MSQEFNNNLKLINGWHFDFKNMTATRVAIWENPSFPRTVELQIRGNGTIGKRYKHDLRKFFDKPEDNYNDIIDSAYIDYLFEKEILV